MTKHRSKSGSRRRPAARFVGVMSAMVLGMTALGQASAQADPAQGGDKNAVEAVPFGYVPADIRQRMLDQVPLKEAASKISWAVERGGGASGFAGIVLRQKSVELWWKGRLPASVKDALGKARGVATVDVKAASHSQAELKKAASGLLADLKENPQGPISQVAGSLTGDGLVLTVKGSAKSLASRKTSVGGVPVSYVEGGVPQADGRYNDYAPYYGGGAMYNDDNGGRCTAGWAVTDGGGQSYLLTAGHCGRTGGGWHTGPGLWIGTGAQENPGHDILLVTASSAGRIWDGDSTGTFTKGVVGWDWVYANEWVCQSGSTSGAVCGIQNTSNFAYGGWYRDGYDNTEFWSDLIVARRTDGGLPSQAGDSGGPVFSLSGDSNVMAKGTVTAHDGSTLYYQDFATAWRDFGISVKTG
ncbi:S1 family peptidase [Sphaerisporangium dianthi]|uniref:S1 family peptidase n=1 Tax=Sphaerisporangium dianthi TaxID=1436120 RepID=A0ABV9CPR7_9ACTN